MNRLFRTQRGAETFSSLLEDGQRDDLDREHAELHELLELVGALRSTARADARPEFVTDLRERLMVAAEAELAPARAVTSAGGRGRDEVARLTVTPRRGGRERRIGVALGTLAVMGATTSMAVASQGAIPGDTLYPLKRAIENTQTGISRGDDAKGESMLGNASGRLDEVGALSRSKQPDAALIAQTLSTFTDQAAQAGDHLLADYADHGNAASISELHAFAQSSVDTLGELEATVPAGARDELVEAAQQVFALDTVAANVCPDCGEPLLELPAQFVNGVTDALPALSESLPGAVDGAPADGQDATGQDTGGQADVKQPSGLEPPTDPISIPPGLPSPDAAVPGGTPASGGTSTGNGGGNGTQDNGGGNGGKGGTKPSVPSVPVDVDPVTETVDEVLTDVLEDVGGLVGGVTGPLLGGTATPAP